MSSTAETFDHGQPRVERKTAEIPPPKLEPGYLLKIPQVCAYLQITRSKLYELIDTGELERQKIGKAARIPAESVIEYKRRLAAADGR